MTGQRNGRNSRLGGHQRSADAEDVPAAVIDSLWLAQRRRCSVSPSAAFQLLLLLQLITSSPLQLQWCPKLATAGDSQMPKEQQ